MDSNNSKKISVLNFVMTLLIVVYHNNWLTQRSDLATDDYLANFINIFARIALTFFFALSGFLLYFGMDRKEVLKRKIKTRLFSLGIPFLIWNVVVFAFNCLQARQLLISSVPELLLGFTFDPFCGQLWYVFALLILLPFAYILEKPSKIARDSHGRLSTFVVCCGSTHD